MSIRLGKAIRQFKEEMAGDVARARQRNEAMDEERERFGEHPGDVEPLGFTQVTYKGEPVKDEASCTCFPWDGIHAVDCPKALPRENPAHRERHGLEGAYDSVCQDVCCKPSSHR